jgi:hypothetical protein
MRGNAVIPGALKSANPIQFSKDRPGTGFRIAAPLRPE